MISVTGGFSRSGGLQAGIDYVTVSVVEGAVAGLLSGCGLCRIQTVL